VNKTFQNIKNSVKIDEIIQHAIHLTDLERGQTFENYRLAAEYTKKLCEEAGLTDCEIINFPADGFTTYQDKRMPIAWHATMGSVTITSTPEPFEDSVVADYQRHPFHLVKGSVSTPEEGLEVEIITEGQLYAGQCGKGNMIMLNPETRPRHAMINTILDLGAIGFIADNLVGRYDTPDGIQWVQAATCGNQWHVQGEDREFIAYSVSPRTGDKLRDAASKGGLKANIISDGKRCKGDLPTVSVLIPGKRKEELWILSHLYEPMIDDNSTGVVGSIETARIIKELSEEGTIPELEFSLRLIFGLEMYSYSAAADHFKADNKTVIGGLNTDAFAVRKNTEISIYYAPPSVPFFGNPILTDILEQYQGSTNPIVKEVIKGGIYGDDDFLSDSTVGIPTAFFRDQFWPWWHNSEQLPDMIDPDCYSNMVAFTGSWLAEVLTTNKDNFEIKVAKAGASAQKRLIEEEKLILNLFESGLCREGIDAEEEITERMKFCCSNEAGHIRSFNRIADIPLIEQEITRLENQTNEIIKSLLEKASLLKPVHSKQDRVFDYADSIVPARATRGFPHDLVEMPVSERRPLPDSISYGPTARIFSNMDGKKTLKRLIREAEWEEGKAVTAAEIKKHVSCVSFLSDYPYLNTEFKNKIEKQDIVKALRESGINEGSLVVVHSSLSSMGKIIGGSDTVVDAYLEAVGKTGTVMFPTFTRPYLAFNGNPNKSPQYRPYDINDYSQISVGTICKAFAARKEAIRSVNPSHSFSAIGPLAEELILEHKEDDAPTSMTSPLGKMVGHNGIISAFGCGIGSTTFLHLLEDVMDLDYLGEALVAVKNEDGSVKRLLIKKHLPGHRDFYMRNAEQCKFFKKAVKEGLEIKTVKLGAGKIQNIEADKLFELGKTIIKEDPRILLCDVTTCKFCSSY
jgi:aminoglycoside 3-N-acetyltransferase